MREKATIEESALQSEILGKPGDRMTGPSKTPGAYYVWEPPGKAISIHLAYEVVDRVLQEVMRGFGAVPRRGAEVGGILLGSTETGQKTTVRIDDYEAVPCEYLSGPSYILAGKDQDAFQQSALHWAPAEQKRIHAVGYFRSHTREGGLALSVEDVAICDSYLFSPGAIALLIRPFATRVSVGGFFFRENGVLQRESSVMEFPFRRRDLGGGVGVPEAPPVPPPPPRRPIPPREKDAAMPLLKPGPSLAPEADQESAAQNLQHSLRRFRNAWVWFPLSFIFLLFGVLLGFQAAFSLRPRQPLNSQDLFSLAMFVSRAPDSLTIHWNAQSLAVRNAQRGVLTISDGSYQKALDLDAGQLQVGAVIYRRLSPAVNLKLEVFTRQNNSVAETVEYREPPPFTPQPKP